MATLIRAMRLRVYPTPEQAAKIDSTLGACRYVYNHMLAKNKKAYKRRGEHLSYYDMQNLLPDMKGYTPWLKEADSQALKYACNGTGRELGTRRKAKRMWTSRGKLLLRERDNNRGG